MRTPAGKHVVKNGLVDAVSNRPVLVWDRKVPDARTEEFKRRVRDRHRVPIDSYKDLYRWSIDHYADFWAELWDYFGVVHSKSYDEVMVKTGPGFLDNEWFTGARLNYAENMLRHRDDKVALICADELGHEERITYAQLFEEVRGWAAAFRSLGLKTGDRVACYMSHRKEAVFAMLATQAIGAMWGGPLPFYGARAATNIIKMIEPKFLLAVDHHQDNGTKYHTIDNLQHIVDSVPSLEHVIIVPTRKETLSRDLSDIANSCLLPEFLACGRRADGSLPELHFEQLPFNHPAFINFTSGTTGLPKGPVHMLGSFMSGMRDFALQHNFREGDVVLTCYPVGWTLWDYFVPTLALGATIVLYNGNPYYLEQNGGNFWDVMSKYKVAFTFLVTSIVDKMEKDNLVPSPSCDLQHLKMIGIGGSPVKRQNFDFLCNKVKEDIFAGSMYGSTEVFGSLSSFDLNLPAYAGEIQCVALGTDIQCFDPKGNSVVGQRGELVIATPNPALPLYLWKDAHNARLKDIYFSKYPGVWSQNDECWMNPRTGGVVVIGRNDDTLKQNGERFGSGDIYFAIHQMEELQDYLCVGQDCSNGDTRAILFVKPRPGLRLTADLKDKIAQTITQELWVDYVPQLILEAPEIPYNLNNKRMESVVRKIVATNCIPEAMNIKNPGCLKHYVDIPDIVNYNKH